MPMSNGQTTTHLCPRPNPEPATNINMPYSNHILSTTSNKHRRIKRLQGMTLAASPCRPISKAWSTAINLVILKTSNLHTKLLRRHLSKISGGTTFIETCPGQPPQLAIPVPWLKCFVNIPSEKVKKLYFTAPSRCMDRIYEPSKPLLRCGKPYCTHSTRYKLQRSNGNHRPL